MKFRISQFLFLLLMSDPLLAQDCSVDATPMIFGMLESFPGPAVDSSGSVTVNCNASASYIIRLDAGLHSNGQFITRRMSLHQASGFLDYNLYRDAARTLIWGDGMGGSSSVQGSSTGGIQTTSIYGRVNAGQNLQVGDYSDIITVTVDW